MIHLTGVPSPTAFGCTSLALTPTPLRAAEISVRLSEFVAVLAMRFRNANPLRAGVAALRDAGKTLSGPRLGGRAVSVRFVVGVPLGAVSLANVVVGAMAGLVEKILRSGSPSEVAEPVVGPNSVQVPNIMTVRAWPDERFQYDLVDDAADHVVSAAEVDRQIARLLPSGGHDLFFRAVRLAVAAHKDSGFGPDSPLVGGRVEAFPSRNRQPALRGVGR